MAIIECCGGNATCWQVGDVYVIAYAEGRSRGFQTVTVSRAYGRGAGAVCESPYLPVEEAIGRYFEVTALHRQDGYDRMTTREVLYDNATRTFGPVDVKPEPVVKWAEEKQRQAKEQEAMKGSVYEGVVVRTEKVPAGAGLTDSVEKSTIIHDQGGKFIALSDESARQIVMAAAIKAVKDLDPADPTQPVEVIVRKFGT